MQSLRASTFVDFAGTSPGRSLSLRESYLRDRCHDNRVAVARLQRGLALLAGPLILTVYGLNWIGAATPLSLFAISGLILTSNTMAYRKPLLSRMRRIVCCILN